MAKRKNKTQIYLKTNKTTKIIKDIKNITKI
jgi:general stress protein 26